MHLAAAMKPGHFRRNRDVGLKETTTAAEVKTLHESVLVVT